LPADLGFEKWVLLGGSVASASGIGQRQNFALITSLSEVLQSKRLELSCCALPIIADADQGGGAGGNG